MIRRGDTHRVEIPFHRKARDQSIFRITIKVTCTPVSTLHRWFTEPGHETSSSSTLIFDTRETVASWQKRDDRRIRNRGLQPPRHTGHPIDRDSFFFSFLLPFENKRDQIYIYVYIPYILFIYVDRFLLFFESLGYFNNRFIQFLWIVSSKWSIPEKLFATELYWVGN